MKARLEWNGFTKEVSVAGQVPPNKVEMVLPMPDKAAEEREDVSAEFYLWPFMYDYDDEAAGVAVYRAAHEPYHGGVAR